MTEDLFYGTSGPHRAKIAFVAEAWGKDEDREKRPLVGASGQIFNQILGNLGLRRDEVFCTNLVSARPDESNNFLRFLEPTKQASGKPFRGIYPRRQLLDGLDILYRQIRAVNPDILVGLGNWALWALTENSYGIANDSTSTPYRTPDGKRASCKVPTGILTWRGSQLTTNPDLGGFKFVPTLHPALLLRQPELRRYISHDIKSRVLRPWVRPAYQFTVRPSFEDCTKYLDDLCGRLGSGQVEISVDLETRSNLIACVGLALDKTSAICIPFMCVENLEGYWSSEQEFQIVLRLRQALTHPNACIIGQNFLYDAQYFALYMGFIPRVTLDTMWAQHVLWPGDPRGLSYMSSMYCNFHAHWKEEGKTWDPGMPEEQLWNYNCQDAVRTFEVAQVLKQLLMSELLWQQFMEFMQRWWVCLDMMLRGILVDQRNRFLSLCEVNDALKSRESFLEAVVSPQTYPRKPKASLWFRSEQQTKEILYDILGLPRQYKYKGRLEAGAQRPITVDDDALSKLGQIEPVIQPITQAIREYRSLEKSSEALFSELGVDGRLRCTFNIGPVTLRLRSGEDAFGSGTNLQNLSRGYEEEE